MILQHCVHCGRKVLTVGVKNPCCDYCVEELEQKLLRRLKQLDQEKEESKHDAI